MWVSNEWSWKKWITLNCHKTCLSLSCYIGETHFHGDLFLGQMDSESSHSNFHPKKLPNEEERGMNGEAYLLSFVFSFLTKPKLKTSWVGRSVSVGVASTSVTSQGCESEWQNKKPLSASQISFIHCLWHCTMCWCCSIMTQYLLWLSIRYWAICYDSVLNTESSAQVDPSRPK